MSGDAGRNDAIQMLPINVSFATQIVPIRRMGTRT